MGFSWSHSILLLFFLPILIVCLFFYSGLFNLGRERFPKQKKKYFMLKVSTCWEYFWGQGEKSHTPGELVDTFKLSVFELDGILSFNVHPIFFFCANFHFVLFCYFAWFRIIHWRFCVNEILSIVTLVTATSRAIEIVVSCKCLVRYVEHWETPASSLSRWNCQFRNFTKYVHSLKKSLFGLISYCAWCYSDRERSRLRKIYYHIYDYEENRITESIVLNKQTTGEQVDTLRLSTMLTLHEKFPFLFHAILFRQSSFCLIL